MLAAISVSFVVSTILGLGQILASGETTVSAEFLLYLLVSTIVIAAILGGFVLYASRDAAFVIALILMIALMLLSRALPEPKFDPISLGSIAAGMVTLFLYVASLRSS